MSYIYQRTFPRSLSEIHAIRKDVDSLLMRFDFAEQQINNYQLILTEYLSNLMRHSASERDELELQISTGEGRLTISVKDASPMFHPLGELLSTEETMPVLADESGMGMLIIKQLVDNYDYVATDDGCEFSFRTDVHTRKQPVVLLVDDDPVILAVISEYLADEYEVMSCESVDEALQCIEDKQPDLIISDIEMPNCDGIGFRQRLAENKYTDRIPFMYLTAVADDKVKELAISHGIDDYLAKPVAKQDILSGVARILRREHQRSSADVSLADQTQQARMLSRLPQQIEQFDVLLRQETAETLTGDFVLHHQDADADYFILGDVMGHGPDAAFYSYSYSGYIRAIVRTSQGQSLTELATAISDAVFQDQLLEQQLMTMLMIKCSGDEIELLSAGHPEPLIIQNNHIDSLAVTGPLLGLFSGQRFQSVTVKRTECDAVLCYTDGLVDAMGDISDATSLARKLDTLLTSTSSAQLLDQIIAQIPARSHRQVNDDVTCLMLSSRH